MTDLTKEQRKLQKQVIKTITERIILGREDIDVIFDKELNYESELGYMHVNFLARSKEAANYVYEVLSEIRYVQKIWFDSAFYTSEPLIEWSLDWSLEKIVGHEEE